MNETCPTRKVVDTTTKGEEGAFLDPNARFQVGTIIDMFTSLDAFPKSALRIKHATCHYCLFVAPTGTGDFPGSKEIKSRVPMMLCVETYAASNEYI